MCVVEQPHSEKTWVSLRVGEERESRAAVEKAEGREPCHTVAPCSVESDEGEEGKDRRERVSAVSRPPLGSRGKGGKKPAIFPLLSSLHGA